MSNLQSEKETPTADHREHEIYLTGVHIGKSEARENELQIQRKLEGTKAWLVISLIANGVLLFALHTSAPDTTFQPEDDGSVLMTKRSWLFPFPVQSQWRLEFQGEDYWQPTREYPLN